MGKIKFIGISLNTWSTSGTQHVFKKRIYYKNSIWTPFIVITLKYQIKKYIQNLINWC